MASQHNRAKPQSSLSGLRETEERVAEQRMRVATIAPGTEYHKIATNVLLLLQDSLHALREAHETIAAVRQTAAKDSLAT